MQPLVLLIITSFPLNMVVSFFSDGSSNLIFICVDCLKYFKYCLQLQNFCFKELMNCLSERYLREGKDLALPTAFERLI